MTIDPAGRQRRRPRSRRRSRSTAAGATTRARASPAQRRRRVALISPACSTGFGRDRERAVGRRCPSAPRATTSRSAPRAGSGPVRRTSRARSLTVCPGVEHQLGRRHLHVRGRALRRRPAPRRRRSRSPAVAALRADRVDRVARDEEDAAARDRGAAENLLRRAFRAAAAVRAVRQLDLAQDLARDRRRGRTMKNLPPSVPT